MKVFSAFLMAALALSSCSKKKSSTPQEAAPAESANTEPAAPQLPVGEAQEEAVANNPSQVFVDTCNNPNATEAQKITVEIIQFFLQAFDCSQAGNILNQVQQLEVHGIQFNSNDPENPIRLPIDLSVLSGLDQLTYLDVRGPV